MGETIHARVGTEFLRQQKSMPNSQVGAVKTQQALLPHHSNGPIRATALTKMVISVRSKVKAVIGAVRLVELVELGQAEPNSGAAERTQAANPEQPAIPSVA